MQWLGVSGNCPPKPGLNSSIGMTLVTHHQILRPTPRSLPQALGSDVNTCLFPHTAGDGSAGHYLFEMGFAGPESIFYQV